MTGSSSARPRPFCRHCGHPKTHHHAGIGPCDYSLYDVSTHEWRHCICERFDEEGPL